MTELAEPDAAEPTAAAGSVESGAGPAQHEPAQPAPPTPLRDLLRALACALLVATCVLSPASALAVAPAVPVLVAIRLVRRAGTGRFLGTTIAACVVAAVLASPVDEHVAAAVAGALLLAWLLPVVHLRAAMHDPVTPTPASDWPEPRLGSGLSPTIAAWTLAVALVAVLAWAMDAAPGATTIAADAVQEAYSPYTEACGSGGALAAQEDLCDRIDAQRATVIDVVEDHAPELLAGLAALFAFGAAATAHLVVLARGRRLSDRVRPAWKLEQLELHWSFAYVLAAGLVGWLLADPMGGDAAVATRTAAVVLMAIGGLAVVSQGVGLVAWVTERGRRPALVRTLLVLAMLVASPVVVLMLFAMGVLDLAIHPRRRAAADSRAGGT